MRFKGCFIAPNDGKYTFRVHSDDGSVLFIRDPEVPIVKLGSATLPTAKPGVIGEAMDSLDTRCWMTVEGNVSFVSKTGEGLEFELRSERDSIWVKVADATGVDPLKLLNSDVRITGVGRGALSLEKRIILGRIMVASAREIAVVESGYNNGKLPSPLTTARQVQSLPIEDAKHELPLRIHGVVTSANIQYDQWMSIQDDTRGIWVNLHNISNSVPACGEVWEVIGHSGAGDFAPVVIAERINFLGVGRMPRPVRPTWSKTRSPASKAAPNAPKRCRRRPSGWRRSSSGWNGRSSRGCATSTRVSTRSPAASNANPSDGASRREPPSGRASIFQPTERPRFDAKEAAAQIAPRRNELDARAASPEPALRPRGAAAEAAAPSGVEPLREEIAALTARLEKMRRDQAEQPAPAAMDVQSLRGELAAMAQSLANLAPRNAVVALEGAMRDLSERVAALGDGGARDALAALIVEAREALRAHDPHAAVAGLERELRTLGAKVDAIAQGVVDPAAFQRIRTQTEEVRNLLAAAASRPVPVERLERQIGELADRVDRLAASPAPQAESARLGALIADARAQIERSIPAAALTAIERRLEDLAQRMDAALRRPPQPAPIDPRVLEDLARRIDSLHGAVERQPDPAKLEAVLRDIAQKLDRPVVAGGSLEPLTMHGARSRPAARPARRTAARHGAARTGVARARRPADRNRHRADRSDDARPRRQARPRRRARHAAVRGHAARDQPEARSRRARRRPRGDDPRSRPAHRRARRPTARHAVARSRR